MDNCFWIVMPKVGDLFDIDVTRHDIPEDAADIWLSIG